MKRDLNTGEIIDFHEVLNDAAIEAQSSIFINTKDQNEKSKLDTGNSDMLIFDVMFYK